MTWNHLIYLISKHCFKSHVFSTWLSWRVSIYQSYRKCAEKFIPFEVAYPDRIRPKHIAKWLFTVHLSQFAFSRFSNKMQSVHASALFSTFWLNFSNINGNNVSPSSASHARRPPFPHKLSTMNRKSVQSSRHCAYRKSSIKRNKLYPYIKPRKGQRSFATECGL